MTGKNAKLMQSALFGLSLTAMASRPVLLWDMDVIAEMTGGAKLLLHHPEAREVALVHDAPWEGNVCCYHTVLYDGRMYRLYYRGSAYKLPNYSEHQVVCYAESADGIRWTKPQLGICEFNGSRDNNIILNEGAATHNFSPFVDTNPACKPEERYKAVGGVEGGLYLYVSPDGIHWRLARPEPIIKDGAFDSQNTMFYNQAEQCYVAHYRGFQNIPGQYAIRAILRATSKDLLNWTPGVYLEYDAGTPPHELYTNAITPYFRNPDVLVGFPKRFNRERSSVYDTSGAGGIPGMSDGVFMHSRNGRLFHRWSEAFLRPGLQHERWVNRNNMTACGLAVTPAAIPGMPDEISLYSTEAYYTQEPNRLRRHVIRMDGFVSVNAPFAGGAFTMKPMTVPPSAADSDLQLLLNASTSALGNIRCEIRDEKGVPIPGFTLAEATAVFGDELELPVSWKGGASLKALAGRTVILHFELNDADVYSLRFGQPVR